MKIDFTRTKAAIEEYDRFDSSWKDGMGQEAVTVWFSKLEMLGEQVGIAFGFDTADRNSMDTCKGCVRPGHKVPAPGAELSFVRKAVKKWEEQNGR